MSIVGVLCICAAVAAAAFGLRSITRSADGDPAHILRRSMAPTQLAAALMLASGGAVALAAPHPALVITCIVGALGTVAAGSWQTARYAARQQASEARAACAGNCAGCIRACQ